MLDTIQNHRINGIDVSALGAVAEAVARDPKQGMVAFKVATRWVGQTRSETVVDGYTLAGKTVPRSHRILVDEPCQLLGEDRAANPQEMLMAAMNACLVVGYVAGAAVRGITLDSLEIHSRGELDMRGFLGLSEDVPPGYQSLDYEVRIKGDATAEQFDEIHQAVIRTSPNYFNINQPIRVNATLVTASSPAR
jgi:uncharacterized OsmC-like protein